MKRFIQGEHRTQGTMLPEHVDDYITEENPARVVDVFVDSLDLRELGDGSFSLNNPIRTFRIFLRAEVD